MPKIESAAHCQFSPDDKILFDANIWIYLYGPQAPDNPGGNVKVYSNVLRGIFDAKSQLFIDVLIISEFINTLARISWKRSKVKKFKRYRNSDKFKSEAIHIVSNLEKIMTYCTRIESGFSSLDIDVLLDGYGTGKFDFNDQVIANLCKEHDLKLVTHDGDFGDEDISIVTANKNILKSA